MKFAYLFCFLSLLTSCVESNTNESDTEEEFQTEEVAESKLEEALVEEELNEILPEISENSSDYETDDYRVELEGIEEVYDFINQLTEVVLSFQYETSISVMNEGPHCDLTNWQHGYSEWKDITYRIQEDGTFKTYWIADDAKTSFPEVDMNELKQYVREFCGEEWYELAKNTASVEDYPLGIATSIFIFKVQGINSSEEHVEKLFHLEVPMGC